MEIGNALRILLLEDSPADAELIQRMLRKYGLNFTSKVVSSKIDFEKSIIGFDPDLILSDHALPQFNSTEAFKIAKRQNPDVPFILVTGSVSEEFAVECMKMGMDDYILKTSLIRLPTSIENIFSKNKIKKEKETIESLHHELQIAYNKIEKNNRSITDSINYAKLIQEAMLPERQILRNFAEHSYIFYRPKDIVSGDFYWFTQRNQKLIVVVADCTGHGVPGALMSMIGYGLLNEIVNNKNITTPSEILQTLNKGINRAFRKSKHRNQQNDGMDIGICSIDKVKNELEFSGANRQLLFFKKKQYEVIKGNKFGVGGIDIGTRKRFTNHKLSFTKEDVIYLFTDGYADQFGGKKEKKMLTKNLIKLLKHTLDFGLRTQEQLLNEWLNKWQGELEQTDDILLVAIEL